MFLFVGREQSWRGVIGAVRSVWTAIFPPNRNFRFYQIWHRHRTDWISIGSVRPAFGCFQFLRDQTDQRKRKRKSQFPFGFPHFLIIQTPSTKQKKKKKLKIMYIFRDHTKIRKYIFPSAFPCFLTTQTPSTKQSSKKKKGRRSVPAKQCTETAW